MTEVLVERHAAEPLTDADIARMGDDASGCLATHRVRWNGSLLSADGRELVCRFSAVDLESVRIVLRTQGTLGAEVWAAALRDAPGVTNDQLLQANVFASWRFEQPVRLEELEELESIDASAAVCLKSHRVRVLRTFIANDRRRLSCLCLAADAESVRLALREAKWPVERVWAFRQFNP